MANMNFKAAAAVAALSALFLAGCSDGAKTEPSTAAASSSAAAPAKTEPSAAPSAAENTAPCRTARPRLPAGNRRPSL